MQGTKYLNSKISKWREKAKLRSKEISRLRRSKKDLLLSRDNWKAKYMAKKEELINTEKELKELKKKREIASQRPKYHSYNCLTILLSIWLRQQGNCSLRTCSMTMKIMFLSFGLDLSSPSPSSIQNWEKKLGLARISKDRGVESYGEWAIILDESISVGHQRVLLILGIELSKYNFGKALDFSQVQVLHIGLKPTWTGATISKELEKIKRRGYSISYACSDGGTNIVKGLNISGITRVSDCTHSIGNLLKNHYGKDEEFIAFSKRCGKYKCQIMLTSSAYLMPPKQRSKGRFLNLRELAKWGHKILVLLENKDSILDQSQREKLEWIKSYKQLIEQLNEESKTMNSIFKILKKDGLSQQTVEGCKKVLEQSKVPDYFKEGIQNYLKKNMLTIVGQTSLICCSDVIESMFGKYKNLLSNSGIQVITDACLNIANFTEKFSLPEVKSAMEKVKIIDLKTWRKQNMPTSIIQQRKEVFKKVGQF